MVAPGSTPTPRAAANASHGVLGRPHTVVCGFPACSCLLPGPARFSPANGHRLWLPGETASGRVRRAALPLGVLVPRRRVATGRARRAGGRARVRGARAHRPRRRLRLARVRARGEGVRRAADHRRGGHARRRRARDAARGVAPTGTRNLCRLLTAAHAGTRRAGRRTASRCRRPSRSSPSAS